MMRDVKRKQPSPDLPRLFAALADPTRLRLLNLVQGREVCVCYLVDVLGQSQSKISRHLAYLRHADLVEARREGKWMHYRLRTPSGTDSSMILEATLRALGNDPEMRADLEKLATACCSGPGLVSLSAATAALTS